MAVRDGDLTAIRNLGNQLGKQIASQIGMSVNQTAPGVVMAHVSAAVALFGWGGLRLERWGDALILDVERLPSLDRENLAMAALLGGLFSTLCAREVACVPIDGTSRYLMVDPGVAERIWAWSKGGDDLPAIIAKLAASEAS